MTKENARKQNNHHYRKPSSAPRGIPVPDDKSVLVLPLGGVGYIGMNWTLYGHKGKWILVDAGSNFAPRDLPIVEAIFPDPAILASIMPRLQALIVTHAHEDHIGAIHRLWPTIKCPIYVTPFAALALKARFEERDTDRKIKVNVFRPGDSISLRPFNIQTIRMTHSAPECVSLAIQTDVGTVYHTGDWKFDPKPMVGKPTNMKTIEALGERGVMAMVCDSTNAQRPMKITSEAQVFEGFKQVFKDSTGMVVVSCFASNVARMASVLRAAAASNRQVAIAGRSLIRYEAIARELGMLNGIPRPLAQTRYLKGLDRREMTLLCTGAQGEANAALSKLSVGDDWRLPKLEAGDTIVHSARVIPGNEEEVHALFDRLRAQGATVIEGDWKGLPLHVTGHATSGEIGMMYDMVKPKFAFPVHGNPEHLEAHAQIALGKGVDAVVLPQAGGIYSVNPQGVTKIAQIEVRLLAELGGMDHRKVGWDEASLRVLQDEINQAKLDNAFDRMPVIHAAPVAAPMAMSI